MTTGSTTPLQRIRAILVRPKTAGNVGAAARAIKNMGLGGLDIIEPHPRRDPAQFQRDACQQAVDAADVLDRLAMYKDLDQAISPATYLVATTARRTRGIDYAEPRVLAARLIEIARTQPVAVLFGNEAHGLPVRLVRRASAGMTIPTGIEYPVLNLAQAVMLVSYELHLAARAAAGTGAPESPAHHHAANEGELDELLVDATDTLEIIDFLKPHNRTQILARLHELLVRSGPTAEEVRMLRGICRQTRWLANRPKGD